MSAHRVDIAGLDADAIVDAANASPLGVDGAIRRAAAHEAAPAVEGSSSA